MTQNLRIASGTTLDSTTSNVASSYTIPSTDLASGGSNTEDRVHDSGNATYGYWYNFCAASAGVICVDQTWSTTTYDICPAGWRLPESSGQSGIAGTAYLDVFEPVPGGIYSGGSLSGDFSAYWGGYSRIGRIRTISTKLF